MAKEHRDFDLEDRLIDFAVRVIRMVEALTKNRIGNHIAGQLIRSGTSPAPNYGEAQGAESKADFIHKMKIAVKELYLFSCTPFSSISPSSRTGSTHRRPK